MTSLSAVIDSLVDESRALWLPPRVAEYSAQPSTLQFLRDHVAQSTPCVWRGAAASWRATTEWTRDNFRALRAAAPRDEVAVTWTPDGRADALVRLREGGSVFAAPHQTRAPFPTFLDALLTRDGPGIPYYSPQDASLSRELTALRGDLDEAGLAPAFAALGEMHAPNLWIGDGRSVTATHADPFDNLYAVVAGAKTFHLRPPCDAAVLPKPALPRARWAPAAAHDGTDGGQTLQPLAKTPGWTLLREEGETAWIDEMGIPPAAGRALRVELRAGDLLYLPALWFHRVEQSGVTIAANWWFEMTFGRDWVYRELCAQLGALQARQPPP